MSKLERMIEGKEQQVLDITFAAVMGVIFGFFLGMTIQAHRETVTPPIQHHYFVCDEDGDGDCVETTDISLSFACRSDECIAELFNVFSSKGAE